MKNQYFIAPVNVLLLDGLSHTDKSVWIALCSRAEWNNEITRGECHPGLDDIARRSSCSKSTVCESLNKLKSLGLIERKVRPVKGGYKSTKYVLLAGDSLIAGLSDNSTVRQPDSPANGRGLSDGRTRVVLQHDKNNTREQYQRILPSRETPEVGLEFPPSPELSLSEGALSPTSPTPQTSEERPGQTGGASLHRDSASLGQVIKLWNEILVPRGFRGVTKGSPAREKAFRARVSEDSERQSLTWWGYLFHVIGDDNSYLLKSAKEKAGWINFDWIFKESNLVKIIEGKYISGDTSQGDDEGGRLEVWEEGDGDE